MIIEETLPKFSKYISATSRIRRRSTHDNWGSHISENMLALFDQPSIIWKVEKITNDFYNMNDVIIESDEKF